MRFLERRFGKGIKVEKPGNVRTDQRTATSNKAMNPSPKIPSPLRVHRGATERPAANIQMAARVIARPLAGQSGSIPVVGKRGCPNLQCHQSARCPVGAVMLID